MEITLFGKQYFVNKVLVVFVLVFFVIGAGVLGYFLKFLYQPMQAPVVEENTQLVKSEEVKTTQVPFEEQKAPEIKIYVTGCVNKPGVVTILKGQIIEDAIRLAGGATKEADLENVNLAYQLDENTMLRIKSKQSNKEASTSSNSNNAAASKNINSGVDIITDSNDTVVGEGEVMDSKKSSLVNINKASQAELENLPNVGPATAQAIVSYREKNGGFKKITDIMKITGIKEKTFDKIKDFICIE